MCHYKMFLLTLKSCFFSERPDQIRVNHHFDDYHLILSVKDPPRPVTPESVSYFVLCESRCLKCASETIF